MRKTIIIRSASVAIAIVLSSTVFAASAQTTDSLRKAAAAAKADTAIAMRYAIDGELVSKEIFSARKDGMIALIAYPGKVFDPKYKGYVTMKVSEKNERSQAVLRLRAKADSMGLKSYTMRAPQ